MLRVMFRVKLRVRLRVRFKVVAHLIANEIYLLEFSARGDASGGQGNFQLRYAPSQNQNQNPLDRVVENRKPPDIEKSKTGQN